MQAAIVAKLKGAVEPLRDSMQMHISKEAVALQTCMRNNGLVKDADAWAKSVSTILKKMDTTIAKIDKVAAKPDQMDVITGCFTELILDVTRTSITYYSIMSKPAVIKVMGKSCFDSFGPFLEVTFKAAAETLKHTEKLMMDSFKKRTK